MLKRLTFLLFFVLVTMLVHAQEISVMSYNIRLDVASDGENRWDARKDKLAGLILYHSPDFIGMQEVLHQQLVYLQDQLKGYDHIGVARDDGKQEGEYSCIFYNREKYTLLKSGTFWLSATPDSVSFGWDAVCRRVCTYGYFKVKDSQRKFWVFNTHFDHVGKQARALAARLILQRMETLAKSDEPVVVTGDFNSKPLEEPVTIMQQVLANAREKARLVYGPAATFNAFQFNKQPENCIDYIFIKPGYFEVEKFATLTDSYELKYPSDHFPVIANMHFIKKK